MGIFNFTSKRDSRKAKNKEVEPTDNQVKIHFGKFKDCDHVAYFCENESEQKNHEKIIGGKLVMDEKDADISVRLEVVNPSNADIWILKENFPTY